ncbi:unnamed protein product [Medioppia subpectinata]|uniref:Uncharacterized protein n=1 Tax=Medioppia subpectinata TaxID=1979941 RepID=A0A7R9Q1S1_9ACAR|nr:unnamed protein product [Medioppia subpectinata]CAG2109549.1 unnamed protein product [Medioppia subpectinata]
MFSGLTLSSMAPAFVDYRALLHTEMQWIGLFPMFQAIGIFCGSFVTIAFKYVNRQILLSILIILQCLGTIFQPWSTQLWHLYLCIFVYGFGIGAWNGSNNFIYGVGTILGPLLDKNYVLGEQICPGVYEDDCKLVSLSNHAIISSGLCTDECRAYDRRPRLKIPLLIGGCLQLLVVD